MSINDFSQNSNVSGSDDLPRFSKQIGDNVRCTFSEFVTWLKTQWANPTFIEDIRIAESGQTIQVNENSSTSDSSNAWLLLTPAATLATLTVKLPVSTSCADGQEVLVTSTQILTALTVNGNGATVNGAPTTIAAAHGFFKLRFSKAKTAWYIVSN